MDALHRKNRVCTRDCDKIFKHTRDGGPSNGTFGSLNFGNGKYASDLQCILTFIALEGYRVKLIFDQFELTGTATSCESDYLDIYSELVSPHILLVDEPLSGRYCGSVSPPIRVSLHNVIVLVFHTKSNSLGALGFKGRYMFIPESEFLVGQKIPPAPCQYTIDQSRKKQGVIKTPTYPGPYPKNFVCTYLLKGVPGQRIKLYFQDFDLYFGGEHCPYDAVTVFDGDSDSWPIIRKVCGIQQKLTLYSYGENLYVVFRSSNPPHSQHRGFLIQYVFSREFVDYPHQYPKNTTCTYILDGLQGKQDLEKVELSFKTFSMATRSPSCSDGYVAIYVNGQDWLSPEESPDYKICNEQPPHVLSSGPRMVLIFKSPRKAQDYGFEAEATFKTDFGITGDWVGGEAEEKCQFRFNSSKAKSGYINSPRYPANYPVGTNCTYFLVGEKGEQVRIYFEQFQLHDDRLGSNRCNDDWIMVWDVFSNGEEKLIGKYCVKHTPGPIVSAYSANKIRLVFSSNAVGTSTGFKAHYDFFERDPSELPQKQNESCGGLIGTNGEPGGSILSPGYPTKYGTGLRCIWEIQVDSGHRIILQPEELSVEGSMIDGTGCPQAGIKIFLDPREPFSDEFCGDDTSVIKHFTSKKNRLRITFITSPNKVNGLKGFNFTWTRIKDSGLGESCSDVGQYRCQYSKYCIHESLKCNGLKNCGHNDTTDESQCKTKKVSDNKTLILGGAGGGLLALLLLIIVCLVIRRTKPGSRRNRNRRKPQPVIHPFLHSTAQL